MSVLRLLTVGFTLETQEMTNPMLDENGQFVSPEQAVNNFTKLWEQWDIVNRFFAVLPKLIIAVAVLLLGLLAAKLIASLCVKAMKAKGVDASVYMFMENIIKTLIRICTVLFALSVFFNINSFLAAIGAAGITAGIGLKDSVAQFASGIQILLNRPFKAGDYIEVAGQCGFVSEIRFMNTIITTFDNKRIIIPNSHITENELINYSAEEKRRVDLVFAVSYSDDISKAKDVILETAYKNPAVLKEPAAQVFVNSHAASSIELIAKLWCNADDYWSVYYAMLEDVKLAFDKNSINIPFNQIDVHIVENK